MSAQIYLFIYTIPQNIKATPPSWHGDAIIRSACMHYSAAGTAMQSGCALAQLLKSTPSSLYPKRFETCCAVNPKQSSIHIAAPFSRRSCAIRSWPPITYASNDGQDVAWVRKRVRAFEGSTGGREGESIAANTTEATHHDTRGEGASVCGCRFGSPRNRPCSRPPCTLQALADHSCSWKGGRKSTQGLVRSHS